MKSNQKSFPQKATQCSWHLLTGVVCGLALFAGVLCACAAALCKMDVPMRVLAPLMVGAVCLAVFIAALVLGMLQKRRGLLLGAGLGLLVFALLWAISALQGASLLTQLAAIKAFSIVIAGALGGYLGVLRSEKKKKLH